MAHEHSDCSKIGANDPEWEPYFGSKLMRARQEYCRGMKFMNEDALAAEDLGLIFAYVPKLLIHGDDYDFPLTYVPGTMQDKYKRHSISKLVYFRDLPRPCSFDSGHERDRDVPHRFCEARRGRS